jgi:hypothetical protein
MPVALPKRASGRGRDRVDLFDERDIDIEEYVHVFVECWLYTECHLESLIR